MAGKNISLSCSSRQFLKNSYSPTFPRRGFFVKKPTGSTQGFLLLLVWRKFLNLVLLNTNIMNEITKEIYLARLASLTNRISQLSQCFNSKEFSAAITVVGIDSNAGKFFDHSFIVDKTDNEMVTFFEQYCTRLAADRINLQIALNNLEKIEGGK